MRARQYESAGGRTPAICIHGLTRNAADFDELAPRIAATGRDVVCFNLRGRGPSDYDPDYKNYFPTTYRDDVIAALEHLNFEKAVFIGTSLGGITTMLVNELAPARVAAAVINDVGPELAPEGIARIAGYVGGSSGPLETIEEAANCIRAINEVAFPDLTDTEWESFARRTFRRNNDGGWVLYYDANIARALAEAGPAPDLWPAFESLKETPTLIIRGAISDLLSPAIIEKMRAVHPHFEYIEVANRGHAPMMTEPDAWAGIKSFLSAIG